MCDMEMVQADRKAWLKEQADGYTGVGGSINPVGKLAAKNPKSRPMAIAAQCWRCEGGDDPGTVGRIEACAVKRCALHPHRPYQPGGYRENLEAAKAQTPDLSLPAGTRASPIEMAARAPERRDVAVKAYCYTCMGGQPAGKAQPNGNARKMVGECAAFRCALWDVRPWQTGADGEETESATERGPEESPVTDE